MNDGKICTRIFFWMQNTHPFFNFCTRKETIQVRPLLIGSLVQILWNRKHRHRYREDYNVMRSFSVCVWMTYYIIYVVPYVHNTYKLKDDEQIIIIAIGIVIFKQFMKRYAIFILISKILMVKKCFTCDCWD